MAGAAAARPHIYRLAWLLLGLPLLVVAVLLCPCPFPHEHARTDTCLSHEKQLLLGLLLHARDHGGRLPAAAGWVPAIMPYVKNSQLFACPDSGRRGEVTYGLVPRWSGAKLSEIPDRGSAIVLYEVDRGLPALWHRRHSRVRYDRLLNYLQYRHEPGAMYVGYADGHCRWAGHLTTEQILAGRDPRWQNAHR